jgi:CrcB protein
MVKVLCVAVGGAAGASMRYLVGLGMFRLFGDRFPAGTLTVNLLGCLLIGLLAPLVFEPREMVRREFQLMIMVGLLGGLTTFSTFGYETFALIDRGRWVAVAANLLLNNVGGIGLALLGYRFSAHVIA